MNTEKRGSGKFKEFRLTCERICRSSDVGDP